MKQATTQAHHGRGAAALAAALIAGSVLAGGCAAKPVAKTATGPAASVGQPPLTPVAAEAQIRSVQENKKLPESAKAGIIAEIRSRQGAASPVPGN